MWRCMRTWLETESRLTFHIIQRANDVIVRQISRFLIFNRRIKEGNDACLIPSPRLSWDSEEEQDRYELLVGCTIQNWGKHHLNSISHL